MTKRRAGVLSLLVWLLVSSPRVPMLAYNHIKGSGDATQCFFFTSYKEATRDSHAKHPALHIHKR